MYVRRWMNGQILYIVYFNPIMTLFMGNLDITKSWKICIEIQKRRFGMIDNKTPIYHTSKFAYTLNE